MGSQSTFHHSYEANIAIYHKGFTHRNFPYMALGVIVNAVLVRFCLTGRPVVPWDLEKSDSVDLSYLTHAVSTLSET